jgi:ABC-type transporter Mla subunit MlaD
MSRRRSPASIVANPVLIGSVTTLVAVVAVFLAYNANRGLPFVPMRKLTVQLPSGANLLPGNEVREGGHLIGLVESMRPVRLADGVVVAETRIKVDRSSGAIPIDSKVLVRPRSVLGLKQLELIRGRSPRVFEDGDILRADDASVPVELDDYFGIFDRRTRRAVQRNLRGVGDALTGRGASLNRTIEQAPRFLGHLAPVMAALGAPETKLSRLFRELGDAARVVAPIAGVYANQFTVAANVFEAWSRHPDRLAATIERQAPTLQAGIESFRVQRPFLADFAVMARSMRRATGQLSYALPRLTPALQRGTPVLERSPEVNEKLRGALTAADELFADGRTGWALRGLRELLATLNPALRFAGPYITVCNYFNYAWTHAGEHITEPDPTGTSQRTLLNQGPRQDNSIISLGAARPANGENVLSGTPAHLHLSLYGAAIDDQGNADCESGQRGYLERLAHYSDDPDLKIVVDPRIPGNQGPTFTGRPRVPAGETFSRVPQIGPAFPPELDTP